MADEAFPVLGISLAYLREFVARKNGVVVPLTEIHRFVEARGGDSAFDGLTTSQVLRSDILFCWAQVPARYSLL